MPTCHDCDDRRAGTGRGRRALVLVATSLAAFTATLDNTVVAVALRDLQPDLDAGVAELQGVVTAYTVALAALLLTGGTLADVVGRRRVLVAGLAVFAAASAACALSDSSTDAHRLARGAGRRGGAGAARQPGRPGRRLPRAGGPGARGRPVGGHRRDRAGRRAARRRPARRGVRLAGGLLGQPAAVRRGGARRRGRARPGRRRPASRRLDLPGQVLVAVGLAAATYAVVLAGRDGLRPPVLVALLVAGGGARRVRRRRAARRRPGAAAGAAAQPGVPRRDARGVRGEPGGVRAAGVPVAVPAARAAAGRAARRAAAAAADRRRSSRSPRSPGGWAARAAARRRSSSACCSPPPGCACSRCGCARTSATPSWPCCSASAASGSA